MNVPEDLRYTPDHEWLRTEADEGVVGITAYAAEELGDIVFVELPAPGSRLEAGTTFGAIESVKTASDLFAPVSGQITAVNDQLTTTPELINSDPYGEGWMLRVKLDDPSALKALEDAAAYRTRIGAA
ncbi:MAG: glycine cleavage system protein GcvH [Chloroflexota bacterium]|nr:glycine cleavage system protein GcvH [Chloroflexota bacterium]